MNVRRWSVPVLLGISLLVAACGGGSSGDASNPPAAPPAGDQAAATSAPAAEGQAEAPAPASGEAIQLRMAWWGSQNRHDRTIKVIELFQQENPNVQITYEFSAFDDYWTKLTTQAAGGNLPCLIQQDYQKIGEWVAKDLLMPLDDFVANGTIDASKVDQTYLDGGKLNGKLYAISLGTNSQTLLFDKQAFEKAGVPIPGNDWTWQDFEQVTGQIKEKLGIYGMSTSLDDYQNFKLWLKQHGKALYNQEGTALGYDDDKLYVDFFTMVKGFMDKGLMPPRDFEVSQGTVGIEDNILVKGEAAIAPMWSNQIVAVSSAAGGREFATGLFPRPAGDGVHHGHYLKPSMFFSISAGCDQPEIAAKLIDMFTNSIPANEILLAERGVPISSVVREAIASKVEPAQQEAFKLVSLVESDPSPLDPPDPAGNAQVVSDVYMPLMDQMLYGQITPEAAAPQFREQANAILAQNQ